MTALHNYLVRITNLIEGRADLIMADFKAIVRDRDKATVEARLIWADGAFLDIEEDLLEQDHRIVKLRYAYHAQRGETLLLRYDNAPHYPGLPNFPHHKHVGDRVEPVERVVDTQEVMGEVDQLIVEPSE